LRLGINLRLASQMHDCIAALQCGKPTGIIINFQYERA
jgi:hypothetical protein